MRCHCFLWLADEHSLAKAYTLPSSGFTQQFLSPTLIALSGTMCIPAPDSGTKPYAIHRSVSRREEILARVLYHHSSSIIHSGYAEINDCFSRAVDDGMPDQEPLKKFFQDREYQGIVSTTGNCDDVSAR